MYDVEDSKSYELVPDGDYEVHLDTAEKKTSKSGKEMLSLTFKIREDVPQAGQGRLIFDNVMRDQIKTDYFDVAKVGCIISTQPNHPKSFQSEDQAIQYINGIDLIIQVSHTDGTDGYEPKNRIKSKFGFKKSKVAFKYNKAVKAQAPATPTPTPAETKPAKNGATAEISDSDLPF